MALICAISVVVGVQYGRPLAGGGTSDRLSSPIAESGVSAFGAGFQPLVERAATEAATLVAMGEARERNLLSIRAGQEAMAAALTDADAWLAANVPVAADEPAVAAYRRGATAIRSAMDEAQAGFLRFDFERVARATETLEEGAAELVRAIALMES